MHDHVRAGRTAIRRVSHYEIRYEPGRVEALPRELLSSTRPTS